MIEDCERVRQQTSRGMQTRVAHHLKTQAQAKHSQRNKKDANADSLDTRPFNLLANLCSVLAAFS